MFAKSNHIQHSLIFASNESSIPLEWCLVRGSALVGSNNICKYPTRVEVTDSDKHSSLLQYRINSGRKTFIVQTNDACTIKLFTSVIAVIS